MKSRITGRIEEWWKFYMSIRKERGGMKFEKFQLYTDWKWFAILPTIILTWDALEYLSESFAISIHWLGWHWRWLWLGKERIRWHKRKKEESRGRTN